MPSFVSFIPTPDEQVEGFFELVQLTDADVVYDLGSGDGRLLFAALAKGAGRAVGVELNHEQIGKALATAKDRGYMNKITLITADVMEVDLSRASLVLCYLSLQAASALKTKFATELRPGTKVIMEMFPVPGWKPVKTTLKGGKTFYLYSLPPEVCSEETEHDPLIDYLNYRPPQP